MRLPDRARTFSLMPWIAALCAIVLLGSVVPATSSAFTAGITNSRNTAASKTRFTCADEAAGDTRRTRAFFEFALNEPADSTTAADSSDAGNPGTYRGAHGTDADSPTACPNDTGAAYRLDGSTSRVSTGRLFSPIMHDFSEEAWFRTSSPGKLMGFEATVDDRSSNYDKHLYVDTSGHLVFGIYNGTIQTIASPDPVNDGAWHHAVATTSGDGSILYLDGRRVAANPSFTTAEGFSGYWRIGWGNLDSWPGNPGGGNWFTGSVRFAAAYPFVLTPQEVAAEASIGAPGTVRAQPTASPSATPASSATPAATSTPAATGKPSSTPDPAASESSPPQPVEPEPEVSATPASGEATATPADPGPNPVKTGSTPIYQPDPSSS